MIHVGMDADAERAGQLADAQDPAGTSPPEPRTLPAHDPAAPPETFDCVATSLLNVPIVIRGETFGILYLGGKRGEAGFTRDDEDTVAELAATGGLAIEGFWLHEQTRQRAASIEVTTAPPSVPEPGVRPRVGWFAWWSPPRGGCCRPRTGDRYAEEFRAELADLPRWGRLAYALRQLGRAPATRRGLAESVPGRVADGGRG